MMHYLHLQLLHNERRERQIAIDGGFGSSAQDPIFWSDPYKQEDEKD